MKDMFMKVLENHFSSMANFRHSCLRERILSQGVALRTKVTCIYICICSCVYVTVQVRPQYILMSF